MKKLKKIHYEVNVSPLTLLPNFMGYSSKELAKLINLNSIKIISLFKNFTLTFYAEEDKWYKAAEAIYKKAKNDYSFFISLMKSSKQLEKEILKEVQKLNKNKINSLKNKEIIFLFRKITHNAFLLSVNSQLGSLADHHHNYFTNQIENIIINLRKASNIKIKTSEIIQNLTTPEWDYPSDKAYKELIEIKKRIKKSAKLKEKLLKRYLQRWYWLNFGHLGPGLTIKEVEKEFNNIKSPGKSRFEIKRKQQKIIQQLSLTKLNKQVFKVARILIYLKGSRAEICNGVYAFYHQVIYRISSETGFPKKYLFFCSAKEIIDYFKNGHLPSLSVLKSRKNFSLWLGQDVFNVKILIGKKAKSYVSRHLSKTRKVSIKRDEIFGNIAFSGRVKGVARIVNTREQMKKLMPGDILVSVQTTPELLPAMKKAVAFITDIGGITSHAAIVAREMKKPCIVGLKIATRVLKDGDLVEVDANKGVIRKLNK